MNQANVKVSFYLKKSEADADGNCPVMAKLNVGKYSESGIQCKDKKSRNPAGLRDALLEKAWRQRKSTTGWMRYVRWH